MLFLLFEVGSKKIGRYKVGSVFALSVLGSFFETSFKSVATVIPNHPKSSQQKRE